MSDSTSQVKQITDRLNAFITSIPVGILILNDQGLVEVTSPSFRKIIGASDDELKGTEFSKLFVFRNDVTKSNSELFEKLQHDMVVTALRFNSRSSTGRSRR